MAWRVDHQVIRGEIENTARGRVTGKIWFRGRESPVTISLVGNCARDLVGRKLAFVNPRPEGVLSEGFDGEQVGWVGHITASRKIKIPDVPIAEILRTRGRSFPWHWGNSIYLEWHSASNGGVTIESSSFEITVTDARSFELTDQEIAADAKRSGEEFRRYVDTLARVMDDTIESGCKPLSEEEAEASHQRSEQLVDRVTARLEKGGESADLHTIIDEEIERARKDRGEPELSPEQEEERSAWIEDANRAAEELLANPDPELNKELESEHPLACQAFELAIDLIKFIEEPKWVNAELHREHPVAEIASGLMAASGKLAGALNGMYWPPLLDETAVTLVRLKRAKSYYEDVMDAAKCLDDVPFEGREALRARLVGVPELVRGVDDLIDDCRVRLKPWSRLIAG
jgi:hypothetical protein